MDRPRALLAYWRNSLADVELRSPIVGGSFHTITPKEIAGGSLPLTLTEDIFKAGHNQAHEAEPTPPAVDLLIAPFTIARRVRHGAVERGRAQQYFPLWIPARLERDGTLQGSTRSLPWISRECLEPAPGDAPVVGSLDAFDRFLESRMGTESTDWISARRFAFDMFQAVAGCIPSRLELAGFEVQEGKGVILLRGGERGAAKALLNLYDALKKSPLPPLLTALTGREKPEVAPTPDDLLAGAPQRHFGQMGDAFPLSPSQRQSVHCLLSMPEGKVLAVNGPPGTGKTTLLQSVISSLWVERAIAGGEPPVILACSTNNQAVTNILDSFAAVASQNPDPWGKRWLPEIGSYGLYLPSEERFKIEEKYQTALPGKTWRGLPERMEVASYLEEAEDHFKCSARSVLPSERTRSVEEIVRSLHEQLLSLRDELSHWIADARDLTAWRRRYGCADSAEARESLFREGDGLESRIAEESSLRDEILAARAQSPLWEILLGFLPPVRRHREDRLLMPFLRRHREPPAVHGAGFEKALLDSVERNLKSLDREREELNKWEETETRFASRLKEEALGQEALDDPARILEILDCSLRYRLFLRAGRYWEGRWLLEMKELLSSGQKLDQQSRKACEERYRRFAKLTPCLVATLHRAPKIFDFFDPKRWEGAPLLGFLDLLIVDEAGQVTPEVGAAVFSLGQRALVVGDIHQIEPVWGITPALDEANLREVDAVPEEGDGEDAIAHRASRGSLMLLARRSTAFTRDDDRGLFLSEHRRCVPEIVRYCNALVYEGRLQPLRPSKRDRILPALGWAHITSPEAHAGGSRSNPGEARAIADWLARHREELERHYGRSVQDVVAVITPFTAQKRALARAFAEAGLSGIKSGTVHAFQGAESPVVLFSSVYSLASEDKAPARLFFDHGSNLLNVAASRAKDSFLVFGDLRLFDRNQPGLPSGKLARLLFELPDNEIADVESAQHLFRLGDVDRIATFDHHREILRRALTESQDRLLLVSPFLSPKAVDADGIPGAIEAARSRGVQICIVYSVDLNQGGGRAAGATRAAERLREAGAEVVASSRVHSKTLAVDNAWIVEGSFNWLSAARDEDSPHHRREASLFYKGREAERFIRNAWRDAVGAEPD